MIKQKFANLVVSLVVVASLLFGPAVPVSAQKPAAQSAAANSSINAMPASATDETKVPHYFGPYPNWANSPQVLADAVVAITADPLDTGTITPAQGVAVVDPTTGGISAIDVINPGSGYTLAPSVEITSPGVTPTALASATAQIGLGVITSISVVETGFGFTSPSVTLSGGNPTPPDATATASGGVDFVNLTYGGSGYVTQPLVTFSLPELPGGVQATATATMDTFGVVTDVILVDSGSGYTTAPTITITDAGQPPLQDPAVAVATIGIGKIDVTNGGMGYDSAPTVTITDLGGTATVEATATANIAVKGAVTGITVTSPGAGYLTPGLKKFVDTLAGLGPTAANDLGQYIPVAVPDTTTYPGTDYYEIGVVQYRMKFHRDLPATLLRGYVQLSTNVVPGAHVALSNANLDPNVASAPIYLPDGVTRVYGVDNPHYLGPTIVASKDRAVRILFRDLLPTGVDGNLFIPVDTSLMGAGMGPNMVQLDANGVPLDMTPDQGSVLDGIRNPECGQTPKPAGCFTENRATLHLHGGVTPWISDGTPHQWITPAGENTDYPQGVSVSNVPDMPDPGPGAQTFFYTNQQSARLMFYHDHSWGITRLNVYAGEAAGYVITDAAEQKLIGTGGALAGLGIGTPLIIQDKTFVSKQIAQQDPTWDALRWGGEGSLWTPHVYMPAQNPGDPSGMSAFGRWMYGPWFWPPARTAKYPPMGNPYYDAACDINNPATWQYQSDPFCEPALIPSTPNISVGMEAFNDTPIVNGTAYPTTTVDPKAYRYRILNAANDRFFNLSWYVADPRTGTLSEVALNPVELAAAQTDPVVFPTPDTTWSPAGPSWIQIGTEGGFLPAPVVVPAQPTTWITDPTRFDVGNVDLHSLLLAPAERADVIVDFSQYRGKTLILYNDAPAAFPARVPGYDYYTGGPDLSPSGAPTTLPGYGPNTRTIMQVKVSSKVPAVAFDRPNTTADGLGILQAAFAHKADGSGVFESSVDPIIVGQAAYNSAYGTNFVTNGWCNSPTNPSAKCDGFARIQEQGLPPLDNGQPNPDAFEFKFDTLNGAQLKLPLQPKAIHDEMNSASFDEWGRMTANLGLEAPGATPLLQNIVLFPYVNTPTELVDATSADLPSSLHVTPISSAADGTQIWKITHNGVDTHPIHFHLYDVQVINRVTWDGIIIPPEPTELGWKDTVRISPLEDTLVVFRPILPTLPFGLFDSKRVLNPMMPEGAVGDFAALNGQQVGFNNTDPAGQPLANPIVNAMTDFGWEYVYHCHILSHEEMDMMRPVVVTVSNEVPYASVLSATGGTGAPVVLTWNDGDGVTSDPATWGDPKAEVGYRIERSTDGVTFAPFDVLGKAIANATTFTDNTADFDAAASYFYRVVAFNQAGETASNIFEVKATPPSDPTNLVATAISGNQIDLTWTDNAANETNFRIERALVTDGVPGAFASVGTVGLNTTTYSDKTAAPLTTYAYQVFAFNLGGASLPSNIATATTLDVPPAAPTTLAATAISSTQVNLTWTDNANNETGFRIERALGGSGVFATVGTINVVDATTFSDVTALPKTTYDYRVFAFNLAGGDSLPSNIATATTPDVPPAAPTTLTAVAPNPTTVNLAWTDNATNETSFRIERADGGQANWTSLGTVNANIKAYSDLTALPSATFDYRVFAVNSGGDSSPSNTATVTTPSMRPLAPTGLTATAVNPTTVNLAWADNSTNETGFRVERALVTGGVTGAFTAINTAAPANVANYSDTTALPNTTYAYRVYAFNASGFSLPTNVATVTTPFVPLAPTSLTATAISLTQVDLNWTDNSTNATEFRIFRATGAGASTLLATVTGAHLATYSDTTVAQNTTYSYIVYAANAYGPSLPSNTATITTPFVPAAPTGLTATLQITGVSLTWIDNATNETGFKIERAQVTGGVTGVFTPLATVATSTYIDTTVAANTRYAYRVYAYNAFANSAMSNTVLVTVPVPPAAPTNLVGTLQTGPQVRLIFRDNATNELGFVVERSVNGGAFTQLTTLAAKGNTGTVTYNDAAVTAGNVYAYQVKAVNTAGSSAYSNIATVSVIVPAAPTNANVTAVANGTTALVTLTWTDNANNETGFRIQRASNATFTAGLNTNTVGANTVKLQQNRNRGTTYYYRIQAYNSTGASVWVNFTPFPIVTP